MKFGFSQEGVKGEVNEKWMRKKLSAFLKQPHDCCSMSRQKWGISIPGHEQGWQVLDRRGAWGFGLPGKRYSCQEQEPQLFLQQLVEIPYSSAQTSRMSKLPLLKHCSKASIKTESKDTESKILALVEMKDKFVYQVSNCWAWPVQSLSKKGWCSLKSLHWTSGIASWKV